VEEGADGTTEKGGVCYIRFDSGGFDKLTCLGYFLDSLGGERAVIPPGEFVFEVPGGFSVADEDEGVLVCDLERRHNCLLVKETTGSQRESGTSSKHGV